MERRAAALHSRMKIAIVGPGRLGKSLTILWRRVGHSVTLTGRNDVPTPADVTVLTVPDREIANAAQRLPFTSSPVLHTSGACELDVLAPHSPAGSLHPLMTFPGPDVAIPELGGVAAAVAGHPKAIEVARALATDLGMRPFHVPGDRRLYHAAAVIAGNFASVLLLEAARVLEQAGVPPDQARAVLAPLAVRSIVNAAASGPMALTGPAIRGDDAVLDAHRTALAQFGLHDLVSTYDEFSRRSHRLLSSNPGLLSGEEGDPE